MKSLEKESTMKRIGIIGGEVEYKKWFCKSFQERASLPCSIFTVPLNVLIHACPLVDLGEAGIVPLPIMTCPRSDPELRLK